MAHGDMIIMEIFTTTTIAIITATQWVQLDGHRIAEHRFHGTLNLQIHQQALRQREILVGGVLQATDLRKSMKIGFVGTFQV